MPVARLVPRNPQLQPAAGDPPLPAPPALPDQGFGVDALLRDPYIGFGQRLGEGQFLS